MTNGKAPPQNLSQLPAFAKQALLHVVCASRGLFKEILLLFLAEAVKMAMMVRPIICVLAGDCS